MYEWDDAKNERNKQERGLAFDLAREFEWETALIIEDTRQDYDEQRFMAMGMITGKLYAIVYTHRHERMRIISLRRANTREEKIYEKNQKT